MSGLRVAGNWVTPIVSESCWAALPGEPASNATARAQTSLPSRGKRPRPGNQRDPPKRLVRSTENALKCLNASAFGHIIARWRGRIRDASELRVRGKEATIPFVSGPNGHTRTATGATLG